ncbi:MAG: carboxypeptidase-like regulatory domain-containing protein [Candidatus Edwardsbacteria bacterium]
METITHIDGYYLIDKVPVGIGRLEASKMGYNPVETDVKVIGDSSTIVNFALTKAEANIKGEVMDASTGKIISSANVAILGTTIETIASDGFYFIPNVSPGIHSLKASRVGYNPMIVTDVRVSKDSVVVVDFRFVPVSVQATEGEIKGEKPTKIKYTKYSTNIKGRITDAKTGESLPGATVVVLGTHISDISNIDGNYVIQNAPVGICSLRAYMMGYERMTVKDIRVPKDSTVTVDFRLAPEVIKMPRW